MEYQKTRIESSTNFVGNKNLDFSEIEKITRKIRGKIIDMTHKAG